MADLNCKLLVIGGRFRRGSALSMECSRSSNRSHPSPQIPTRVVSNAVLRGANGADMASRTGPR